MPRVDRKLQALDLTTDLGQPRYVDLAVVALRERKGPMTCGEIIGWARQRDLVRWSASAPARSLWREMKKSVKRGLGSPFVELGQGRFDLKSRVPKTVLNIVPIERPHRPYTYHQVAIMALKDKGAPMSCAEVVSWAVDRGHLVPTGKTPIKTLWAALRRSLRDDANSPFVKLESGLFGLRCQKDEGGRNEGSATGR